MDTLLTTIAELLGKDVIGSINVLNILSLGAGSLIPFIVGMILPRSKTVQYGRLMNSFLGKLLLQKRVYGKIPTNIVEGLIQTVQTTFQDISFGVYIDSRKDITPEDKKKKVAEYLVPPAPPAK